MFTGIIQAKGSIAVIQPAEGDMRLGIATGKLDLNGVRLGDSIAVNGVCLTVIELTGDGFRADVSRETIACTTFSQLRPGSAVNLELALQVGSRLGGHLVSGHVDGVGEVVERHEDARSVRFSFKAPADLARYIAAKGSICIDGTSLTVNAVRGARFEVNIVPHTLRETIMADYRGGTRVNLEADLVARYLERLLLGANAADGSQVAKGISLEKLRALGFAQDAAGN